MTLMLKFSAKLIKGLVLPIIAISLLITSCSRATDISPALDSVEAVINQYPDSALKLINAIDTLNLAQSSRAINARYALLKSIALDKNYIDTSNLNIIQPAIDYYITKDKGTPDDKLRTLYYESVIYTNAYRYALAMNTLLRAAQVKGPFTDSIVLAQVYILQSLLNIRQLKYTAAIYQNISAGKILVNCDKKGEALRCYGRALEMCCEVDDQRADSLYLVCQEFLSDNSNNFDIISLRLLTYLIDYGSESNVKNLITKIENRTYDYFTPSDYDHSLAEAYCRIGNGETAISLISKYQNEELILRHLFVAAKAYETVGNYPAALNFYKQYVDSMHYIESSRFSEDLFSVESRFESNLEKEKIEKIQERTRSRLTASLIILILLALTLTLWMCLWRIKRRLLIEQSEKLQLSIDELSTELKLLSNKSSAPKEVVNFINALNDAFLKDMNDESDRMHYTRKELNKIRENPQSFLKNICQATAFCYPNLQQFVERHNLTPSELNVVYLLALGYTTTQIGVLLGSSNVFNISSSIRKKFGLTEKDIKLPSFVISLKNQEN